MNANQHLDGLEWIKATRTDIIDIMKGENTNGGVYTVNANDIEKAEKIIARVLTEVINRMIEPPTTPATEFREGMHVLTREGARNRLNRFLMRVFVHSGKELVDTEKVENDIEDALDDLHYTE